MYSALLTAFGQKRTPIATTFSFLKMTRLKKFYIFASVLFGCFILACLLMLALMLFAPNGEEAFYLNTHRIRFV